MNISFVIISLGYTYAEILTKLYYYQMHNYNSYDRSTQSDRMAGYGKYSIMLYIYFVSKYTDIYILYKLWHFKLDVGALLSSFQNERIR